MTNRTYHIAVMGKTLEHLGSQLYKRRDAALAELVANSWDAGADEVFITLPERSDYDSSQSVITVTDDGGGMTADQIENHYLKVGRNRRLDADPPPERKVMGRKGIGKLAGFGIATEVELITWKRGVASRVVMPMEQLKRSPGSLETIDLEGEENISPPKDVNRSNGTRVLLRGLRHSTPLQEDVLLEALARRFTRVVRGEMEIYVNDKRVGDPLVDFEKRVPETGAIETEIEGNRVTYFYGFSRKVLTPAEKQGFAVYVHGKTAQAPPFFFEVETTATAQHGTKYLYGEIEAGFLDDGEEESNDIISTDRQEIDWSAPAAQHLKKWGEKLTRQALRELRELRGESAEEWVLTDNELRSRIDNLDSSSQKKAKQFIRRLGQGGEMGQERIIRLADGVVAAFEYQHFHDLLEDLEAVGGDPESLAAMIESLLSWKVLESRAILEIVEGRLQIVDKFRSMVADSAPETAPGVGVENLHDLITSFPWLLNPEWQTFEHERQISAQLRQWAQADVDQDDQQRVDFLALANPNTLIVVEIKRPGHAAELLEFQRLQGYIEKLAQSWDSADGQKSSRGLLVASELNFSKGQIGPNIDWKKWGDLWRRVQMLYEHYRGVLQHDVHSRSFDEKRQEIAATRKVLSRGSYLNKRKGKAELGVQDMRYDEDA